MGMYDNDANFEDHFEVGDRLVLMGLTYEGQISTRFGKADKTTVFAVTRESYPKRLRFSALGVGFANMAKRAERGDFPHVAEYIVVDLPNGNTLKRFAKVEVTPAEWKDGNDGPAIDPAEYAPSATTAGTTPETEDIPF